MTEKPTYLYEKVSINFGHRTRLATSGGIPEHNLQNLPKTVLSTGQFSYGTKYPQTWEILKQKPSTRRCSKAGSSQNLLTDWTM
jgi:hypothetical protein